MADRNPRPVFLPPRDHDEQIVHDRDDYIATLLIGMLIGIFITAFGVGLGAWVF